MTFWVFFGMILGVLGVLYFIGAKDQPGAFCGFFGSFLFLFADDRHRQRLDLPDDPRDHAQGDRAAGAGSWTPEQRMRQAEKESAAITGFTSAIAAYGAFFIPKSYGTSISLTGGVAGALWAFFAFYVICVAVTWAFYTRSGGLLHDVERRCGHRSRRRE